ncbi:PPC domain-containing protein, partial [Microcoleus sp. herbarium19]|uniref:PPC domain-containing protein n=2 Tax=unclassified Microcoleus TaxID=2642155 RepID=UPI002FCFFDAF
MAELNIGALTGSKSYTGSVGTANTDNLYKFNINSPGSFQFSLNNLSGNADIFLLNQAGAIIKSSSNSDKTAETISAEGLSAGEYTIRVLQISGDIKYTLNLAQVSSPKTANTDTLTGTKLETASPSTTLILPLGNTSEKPAVSRDAITGSAIEEKAIAPADKPATTTSTTSAVTTTSTTTDKLVTATSTTTDKPETTSTTSAVTTTSTTTDKAATTTSTTTDKP